MSRVLILNMDVMAGLRLLPDESQHMAVTSVPYFGLRDYGIPPSIWLPNPDWACVCEDGKHRWGRASAERAGVFCRKCSVWKGCLGMEPTVQLYVQHIVTIFREVRRVLRRDGTLWLNIGDTYNTGTPVKRQPSYTADVKNWQRGGSIGDVRVSASGLKAKDMCLVPERVITALQDDGWWVRRDIIWHKETCMPEAVTDRPTTAHEYVWILSKRARYFYDWLAIAERTSPDTHARMGRAHNGYQAPGQDEQRGAAGYRENTNQGVGPKSVIPSGWDNGLGDHKGKRGRYTTRQNASFHAATAGHYIPVRNSRSVWTINPEPFGLEMCVRCHSIYDTPEYRRLKKVKLARGWARRCKCRSVKWVSHFATFPTELVERCILAGTSSRGVCPSCFSPWARIVQKGADLEEWKRACGSDVDGGYRGRATKDYAGAGAQDASAVKARILAGMRERVTVGWKPTCKCAPHEPVQLVNVLDLFGGSATTGLVASRLQRNTTLIEINGYYVEMGRWRIVRDAPLLADIEIRKGVMAHGQEAQKEAEAEAGAGRAGVLTHG